MLLSLRHWIIYFTLHSHVCLLAVAAAMSGPSLWYLIDNGFLGLDFTPTPGFKAPSLASLAAYHILFDFTPQF